MTIRFLPRISARIQHLVPLVCILGIGCGGGSSQPQGGVTGFVTGTEASGPVPSDGTLAGSPVITGLSAGSTTLAPGQPLSLSLGYTDAEGDVSVANFGITGQSTHSMLSVALVASGHTSGTILLDLYPVAYVTGAYAMTVSLTDQQGHVSAAKTLTFTIVAGGVTAVDSGAADVPVTVRFDAAVADVPLTVRFDAATGDRVLTSDGGADRPDTAETGPSDAGLSTLCTGATLYLPFSETSGTSTVDVAKAHGASFTGAVTRSVGKLGAGIATDGASYVSVADAADLDPGLSDFAVAAWVKIPATTCQHSRLVTHGSHGQPGHDGYALMEWGGSWGTVPCGGAALLVGSESKSSEYLVGTCTAMNDGQWHHYAGVVNRTGTMDFYVDGAKLASPCTGLSGQAAWGPAGARDISPLANVSIDPTCALCIGASCQNLGTCTTTAMEPFTGAIDEVAFWKCAPTAADVLAAARATATTPVDGGASPEIPTWVAMAPLPGDPPPALETVTAAVTGRLALGTPTALATGTLGQTGGAVVVAKPGDPLDGLTLTALAGALSDGTPVTVSSTPITSHSYGGLVAPATPLITVENGGGMAATPLTVRIPVIIPAGQFALAMYYEASTGALEAIPLVDEDASSLTLATRHFSSFFVSLIDLTKIPAVLDSGFRPGKDDWQFTNYGSFIEPFGQCAGQSISAMWYYLTQRKAGGASALYGLFDNNGSTATPSLWQDDSDGYRFASTVHADINQSDFANSVFNDMRRTAPRLQWNAFRYAMALSGEPLAIGLWSADDKAGHEMIVYRINQNHLFVADPNYPAKWRTIDWDETKSAFNPYNSGTNAAAIASGKEIAFTKFTCDGKTAMVDWKKIAQRWTEFESSAIGRDRFPAMGVLASEDGKTWKAADGFTTSQASVKVRPDPMTSPGIYAHAGIQVFRGDKLLGTATDDSYTVALADGANALGVALWATPKANANHYAWVDFKHVTISRTGACGEQCQALAACCPLVPSVVRSDCEDWAGKCDEAACKTWLTGNTVGRAYCE